MGDVSFFVMRKKYAFKKFALAHEGMKNARRVKLKTK